VVAVAGRDAGRTAAAAAALGASLGHPVEAHAGVDDLVSRGDLDGLVVASPIEAHLEALRLAAARGLSTLCEKPLVHPGQEEHVPALLADFAARGALVTENCPWPFVLEALGVGPARRTVAMRLSPPAPGPSMLLESLSHFLSLIQHGVEVDESTTVGARFTGMPDRGSLRVECSFAGPGRALETSLELEVCAVQPRPAWVELDGDRYDREIDLRGYTWRIAGSGRTVDVGDPEVPLAARFVQGLASPDAAAAAAEARRLASRARLFGEIWRAFTAASFA
jgi:predicted dehydrogenase